MKTLHRTRGLNQDLIVTRNAGTITLWSAAGIRHTVLNLDAPHMPGLEYARNTLAALAFCPQAQSFLVLGLGGGSIPRMLLAARPGISVEAVEIDPAILDLAARYFEINRLTSFVVHLADAAVFLESCQSKYDVIIVDAYIGEKFPDQCATPKFLSGARNCLTDEGVLVVNWVNGNPGAYQRLVANIERIIGPAWLLAGSKSRNVLHFASPRNITRSELMNAAARIECEIPFETSLGRLVQRLRQ